MTSGITKGPGVVQLKIEGIAETMNVLATFDNKAKLRIGRRFRAIGQMLAAGAAGRIVRRTGPRGIYSETQAAAAAYKVRYRTLKDASPALTVINDSKPGAMIEFAGSVNPGGLGGTYTVKTGRFKGVTRANRSGASFNRTLSETYGPPGRVLWGVFDDLEPWVRDEFGDAVRDAETEAQAILDRL